RELRAQHPGVVVLAHPECSPAVVAEADFAGSTAAMADYVDTRKPGRVVLVTECSMSDNVAVAYPEIEFVRPCNLCPHMKRITLLKIRRALETMREEVTIDPAVASDARRAIERMLALSHEHRPAARHHHRAARARGPRRGFGPGRRHHDRRGGTSRCPRGDGAGCAAARRASGPRRGAHRVPPDRSDNHRHNRAPRWRRARARRC